MNYGEKVLSRLLTPGMLILVVGAVIAYGSGFLAGKFVPEKKEKVSIAFKIAGCALAIIGAVLLFVLN